MKYLNLFSLCLSCSHQESRLPAAAMWEELSRSRGCPRPAKAEQHPPPSLLLSLPPAPSLLPTWGREDDYHQPAVLQCPDGHLPPAVHCRSVKFTVSLSVSLPVWPSKVHIYFMTGASRHWYKGFILGMLGVSTNSGCYKMWVLYYVSHWCHELNTDTGRDNFIDWSWHLMARS